MSTSEPRRRSARAGHPPTVSRAALLRDGSDARFRAMVYDLLTVAARMVMVRDRLAARIGVSGPQYSILMAIAHLEPRGGASVGAVAELLHVSGPFVTAETGKLVRAGLLDKRPNPRDRRAVVLAPTRAGRSLIDGLAPAIRAANDAFFAALDRTDFGRLATIAARLVATSEDAIDRLEARARIDNAA